MACPSTILLCSNCFLLSAIVIIDSGPNQNVGKVLLSSDVFLERVYCCGICYCAIPDAVVSHDNVQKPLGNGQPRELNPLLRRK